MNVRRDRGGAGEGVVFAERLRADLERVEVDHQGKTIRFSCSFGVAQREEGVAILDTLLLRADEALFRAKADGRNRVALTSGPNPGLLPEG